MEYLQTFTEDDDVDKMQLEINLEYFTKEIFNIDSPIFDYSQIECLSYVAGYAVFSYLKLKLFRTF